MPRFFSEIITATATAAPGAVGAGHGAGKARTDAACGPMGKACSDKFPNDLVGTSNSSAFFYRFVRVEESHRSDRSGKESSWRLGCRKATVPSGEIRNPQDHACACTCVFFASGESKNRPTGPIRSRLRSHATPGATRGAGLVTGKARTDAACGPNGRGRSDEDRILSRFQKHFEEPPILSYRNRT